MSITMSGEQPPHQPGDVVNGHVLTSGGQWVPLPAASVPVPPAHYPYGHGQPSWPPQQTIYVHADSANNSSLAPVTALITGLIGLSFCWIPLIGIIGWMFGPLALIFGGLGARRGKSEHKIMSWIGIACGTLTLLICGIYMVAFIAALSEDS